MLEQVHRPGEVLQTDGTWLTELGVTLQGEPFEHLLIHCVLPYSNWEWGRVAQSESLWRLRLGVQSTLVKLGHVPTVHPDRQQHRGHYRLRPTKSKTKRATRAIHPGYLQMLDHYGLKPRTIHVRARTRTATSRPPMAGSSAR